MWNNENSEEKSFSQGPTFLGSTDDDLASDSLGRKHPHREYENVRLTISGNNARTQRLEHSMPRSRLGIDAAVSFV